MSVPKIIPRKVHARTATAQASTPEQNKFFGTIAVYRPGKSWGVELDPETCLFVDHAQAATSVKLVSAGHAIRIEPASNGCVELSGAGVRLLAYLMQHAGRVVGYDEIAEKVYLNQASQPANRASAQVGTLRKELRSLGCHGLLKTFPGRGYGFGYEFDPSIPLPPRYYGC
ncbi:MAG: helix-turn-helix domain-containing protein [Phycisphaeraceae bacterium]|nr:helix-turn-helix domain-containing protein [Phycisphaeraceae bacterium]